MRVISQNRKISVDFDRTVFTNVDEAILAKIDGRDVIFGTYKSEKRAKEVFESIHNAYNPKVPNVACVGGNNSSIKMHRTYVYYMPEE